MGRRGFTLVEMLVVISLIVVLTSIAAYSTTKGNDTRFQQTAKLIASLERKAMEMGTADAFSSAHVHFGIDSADEMAFLNDLQNIQEFSFYANKPNGQLNIHPYFRPYKGMKEFNSGSNSMPTSALASYPYKSSAASGTEYRQGPDGYWGYYPTITAEGCNASSHDTFPSMNIPGKVGLNMGPAYVRSEVVDKSGEAIYQAALYNFDNTYDLNIKPPVAPQLVLPSPLPMTPPLPHAPTPNNGDPNHDGNLEDANLNGQADSTENFTPPVSPTIPATPTVLAPPPAPTAPPNTYTSSLPPLVIKPYPKQPTLRLPAPPDIGTFLRQGLDTQTARNIYDIMYEQWKLQCDGLSNKYQQEYNDWLNKCKQIDVENNANETIYKQRLADSYVSYQNSPPFKEYQNNYNNWEKNYTQPGSPYQNQWGTTPQSNSTYYNQWLAPGCPYFKEWGTAPKYDPATNTTIVPKYYHDWLAPDSFPQQQIQINNDARRNFNDMVEKDRQRQQAEWDNKYKAIQDEYNIKLAQYQIDLAKYNEAWNQYQQDMANWRNEKNYAREQWKLKWGGVFKNEYAEDRSPWFFVWSGFQMSNMDVRTMCGQDSEQYYGEVGNQQNSLPSCRYATTMAKFMTYRGGEDLKSVKRRYSDITITDNVDAPSYGVKKFVVHSDSVAKTVWVCKWIVNKTTGKNQCECGRIKE